MEYAAKYLVYALVFLSILLIIEGGYLLVRTLDRREAAVNRRMRIAQKSESETISPTLLRQTVLGGPVSQAILKVVPNIENIFWAANIKAPPARAIGGAVLVFVILVLLFQLTSILPPLFEILISAAVAFGIPFLALKVAVGRQRKKFDEQLPDALNLITRGLQAGHPVPVAFGLVAREMPDPIGSEFGNAIDAMNFGRDRASALREIAKRFPNPEFMFFIATVEMQRESGGNLVSILDNLVSVIRERSNLKQKAIAVSAEGRLTAIMVGALPYIVLALLLIVNPGFILGTIDNPLFWPLMTGAWVLWLIGMVTIFRMVNIKV